MKKWIKSVRTVLYIFKKWTCCSHNIQITILGCTIQGHLVHSHGCAIITSLQFQNFSSKEPSHQAQKNTPCPTSSNSSRPLPHLLVSLIYFLSQWIYQFWMLFKFWGAGCIPKYSAPEGDKAKERGSAERVFPWLLNIYLPQVTTTFRAQRATNWTGGENDVHLELQERYTEGRVHDFSWSSATSKG